MADSEKRKNIISSIVYAATIIEILLFAGPIYGWASLVPVLVKERYFSHQCVDTLLTNGTGIPEANNHCDSREKSLNLAFTLAVGSVTFVQIPVGVLADKVSMIRIRGIGIVVFTLAGVLWAGSVDELKYLLFGAASLLNMSGFLLYFPLIQLVNRVIRGNKSLLMSLMSGAFDSSAVVLSVVKAIYDAGIPFKAILLAYTLAGTIMTVTTTLASRSLYPRPDQQSTVLVDETPERNVSLKEKLKKAEQIADDLIYHQNVPLTTDSTRNDTEDDDPLKNEISRENREDGSIWSYLRSSTFICQVVFLCLSKLRVVSYIGNLNTTLIVRLHCNMPTANKYLSIFGVTQLLGLPLSAIIGILLDGRLVKRSCSLQEKRIRGCVTGLFVTNGMNFFLNVFALSPVLELQVLTYLCHVTLRAFLFASNFALLAATVPAKHYGKLASVTLTCQGMFSTTQYLLFDLVEDGLNGDPLFLDVAFLVLSVILFVYPCKVYRNHLSRRREGTTKEGNITVA